MVEIHPYYQAHRDAMEAAMRQRLDLAEAMLRERTQLADLDKIKLEVMDEFEIVLAQMPYVGGSAGRMSDFFMRLLGFMAIGRVLRRHGVALPVIGEIEPANVRQDFLVAVAGSKLAEATSLVIDAEFKSVAGTWLDEIIDEIFGIFFRMTSCGLFAYQGLVARRHELTPRGEPLCLGYRE